LLDTDAVGLHAQHLSGLTINARVAIINTVPHALDLARRLGADEPVDSSQADPIAAVMAMTGGLGAEVVFECADAESMPETLPLPTRLVRRGGSVVIAGGFDEGETTIALEWQRIQISEIRLIPSASFAFQDIHSEKVAVLDLVTRGKLQTQPLVTHRFPLGRIKDAFATAQERRRTGAIFVGLEI
jgi:L-iditol 2-dehydrogenase